MTTCARTPRAMPTGRLGSEHPLDRRLAARQALVGEAAQEAAMP